MNTITDIRQMGHSERILRRMELEAELQGTVTPARCTIIDSELRQIAEAESRRMKAITRILNDKRLDID